MLQQIQAQLHKWFWEGTFGTLLTVLITAIVRYQDSLASGLFKLPHLAVFWTLVILVLLVFTLAITLCFIRPRFYWDPVVGTWNNRRNHLRHCGVCYSKGLVSPLKNETKGWSCLVCKQFYIDSTRSHTQTLPHTLVTTVRMRIQ